MKRNQNLPSLILLLFLFVFTGLNVNAQQLVSIDSAMEKLEVKLADVIKDFDANNISEMDKDLYSYFINLMVVKLTGTSDVPVSLNAAYNRATEKKPTQQNKITAIKDELTLLLQE